MFAAFDEVPSGAFHLEHGCVEIFPFGKADADVRRIPLAFGTSVESNNTPSGQGHEEELFAYAEFLACPEGLAVEALSTFHISDVNVEVIDRSSPYHQTPRREIVE